MRNATSGETSNAMYRDIWSLPVSQIRTATTDRAVSRVCQFSFFFFLWYGDHRDLHSFPTRRSSDLPGRTELQPCRLEVTEVAEHGAQRGQGDRKSTRLNSSHGSISYAVFCLKKK